MSVLSARRCFLGSSGVSLPPLGFGAAPIGNLYREVSDAVARQAVTAALASGIDYFDTAPHYGFGLSERRLGRSLADRDAPPVLSTKVGRRLEPAPAGSLPAIRHGFAGAPALEPVFDYSYDGVMRAFESSLQRLARERVDILLVHDLGELTHGASHLQRLQEFLGGGYRAMEELRRDGRVGAIGAGANEWQIFMRLMEVGDFDTFLLAGRYTLLEQTALDTFLPACAKRQISVIAAGPFNSGILASGVSGPGPHYYNYEAAPAAVVERVRRLELICEAYQVPLAAAALQFPAAHPQVATVLTGLADAAQVDQAVAWMTQALPGEFWRALKSQGLLAEQAPVPTFA